MDEPRRKPTEDRPGDQAGSPRVFRDIDRERLGIIFIVVAILVLAIAIVSGAVGLTGLVIVGALLGLLLLVAFRRDESKPVEVAASSDRFHRVLVLANEGLGGRRLKDALERGERREGSFHVRVIVPLSLFRFSLPKVKRFDGGPRSGGGLGGGGGAGGVAHGGVDVIGLVGAVVQLARHVDLASVERGGAMPAPTPASFSYISAVSIWR